MSQTKTNTMLDTLVVSFETKGQMKEFYRYLESVSPDLRWSKTGKKPTESGRFNGDLYVTASTSTSSRKGRVGICTTSVPAGRRGQFAGRAVVAFSDMALPSVPLKICGYAVEFLPDGSGIKVGCHVVGVDLLEEIMDKLDTLAE